MFGRSAALGVLVLALLGCTDSAGSMNSVYGSGRDGQLGHTTVNSGLDGGAEQDADASPRVTPLTTTSLPPPTTAPPTATINGTVVSATDGGPLADAMVRVGEVAVSTAADGTFELTRVAAGTPIVVERPVWRPVSVDWPADDELEPLVIELEPVVVRALRVSRYAAADPERFDDILELADRSTVNALVFDTKDETDTVLYETTVAFANASGAVDAVYNPTELLAKAREHDLYTVTRIVTFEDSTWVDAAPDAKLAGAWVDASNRDNWAYPLELAVEACGIGFDEIQFDYVRFPAGRTAQQAAQLLPQTSDLRAAVIGEFLTEARNRLHPLGCGVSAAIFGIVVSSETDEGIGQTPETVSAAVDAVSPMLYPSHYSPGWLGFADPNDHPGPVIAHALDAVDGRMAPNALMRPWLQGFYYNSGQVLEQIREAEARGAGWIIWNASGTYNLDWLPSS